MCILHDEITAKIIRNFSKEFYFQKCVFFLDFSKLLESEAVYGKKITLCSIDLKCTKCHL